MKLKKSIVFLLLFCLLFSNTIIVHATESMSLSVGSCDAAPGETVSIPILLNSNTGFVSMSLSVTYDTSALMLISYGDTGVIGGTSHSSHFTSPYVLTWENDTLTSNITSTGTIVYLTFLVSEDAKEQDYSIIVRIPTDGILDANGDTVSASSAMGKITVSAEHECSFGAWEYYSKTKHVRYCDGDGCDEKEYKNHNWNDGEIIEDPSHDEEGEIEYTCKDCGATKTTEIDPEGHDWGDWMKLSDTQHKRTCSCGDTETEEHNWNNGITSANIITYNCEDCEATKTETIAPDTVPVTGITLNASSVTLKVGDKQWIDATVLPDNATNKLVNWTCSDFTVADIAWSGDNNACGLIVARSKGTAVITASTVDGSFVAQCTVTVIDDNTPVDPNAPAISIDNVTSSAGKTVEVNIALKNNPGILGASFTLSYSEELTLISAQKGEALSSLTYTAPGELSNPCRFGWDGVDESDADGVVLTLTFKVPDNAKQGDSYAINISYDNGSIFDNSMNAINFSIESGSIKIPEYVSGDLNDDGIINMQDVVLLRRHIIGGYNVVINDLAADVNRDGLLNMQDVVLIRRYIVGGYGVELK